MSRFTLSLTLAFLVAGTTSVVTAGDTPGPDVTVFYLGSTSNYGTATIDDVDYIGYSVGTTSCNLGDEPVWWCDNPRAYCEDEQHPVIAQNLYRLKDDRFEQVGMSWLKHGFLSTNSDAPGGDLCGDAQCIDPPHGGDQLGLGCLDTYGSGLNGSRPLGMRSEVNATNGLFPFPETSVGTSTVVDQRVRVRVSDVDPAQNSGATYWVEGHYITEDDAVAGNGLNNASHRRVTVSPGSFSLSLQDSTVRLQPAIMAWPAVDPTVELTEIDFVDDEIKTRFHVARKVIENGPNDYHYEYAVHNMNANLPAYSFTVGFAAPATITNVGFSDVDQHSGEPWDTTDWGHSIEPTSVTWGAVTDGAQANAIRWGTMFSFWFDSTLGPKQVNAVIVGRELPMNTIFVDGFESGDTTAW